MSAPIFIANLPDDLHCSQACIRMVCEALGKPISWEEADRLTGFLPGFYTWPPKSVVEINNFFPGTKYWTDFDYKRFGDEGRDYLLEYYHGDQKWVVDQETHATPGFKRERAEAKEMIDAGLLQVRNLLPEDLQDLVAEFFIIAFVHFGKLYGVDNNTGHAILIYDVQDGHIVFHDPGLPPRPSDCVLIDHFMKAYQNGATLVPRK